MRLYSGKVRELSEELTRALVDANDIETEHRHEVAKDLESVLHAYIQAEREVNERAKDLMQSRGLPPTELGRVKRLAADQRGIKIGEDMLDYLLEQLVEMLMHSNNVEEVFAEDHELRRRMRPALRKHLELESAVEAEIRSKLKHVQEGSRTWEIEYQRIMGDIQRRKGLG
ncbi:MAG: DUF507 family protein [Polyangiaceae bacterium]